MSSFLFWIKKRMSPQGNLKDNMGIIFVYTRGLFCCGMVVTKEYLLVIEGSVPPLRCPEEALTQPLSALSAASYNTCPSV